MMLPGMRPDIQGVTAKAPRHPFVTAAATPLASALLGAGIADAAIYAEAVAAVTDFVASQGGLAPASPIEGAENPADVRERLLRDLAWLAARERRAGRAGPIARLLAAVSQVDEPEGEVCRSSQAARFLLALLAPGAEALP